MQKLFKACILITIFPYEEISFENIIFFSFLNVIYTEILDISYDAILFAIVNKRYYLWNELHSFFIRGNIRYSYVTI